MTYPSNSDSVAQDQLRAFVERILRMREEAKAINDDIREIYAEAKGNGFDKTVLGKVVLHIERHAKDPAGVAEASAIFDLYLASYFGTGTPLAIAHTHEALAVPSFVAAVSNGKSYQYDAETGEIIAPNPVVELQQVRAAPVDGDEIGEGGRSAFPAPLQPGTADQSTAALMEVRAGSVGETAGREMAAQPDLVHAPQAGTQAPPVDTTTQGAPVGEVLSQASGGSIPPARATLEPQFSDPAHKLCLKPSFCGGYSNLALCNACKEAAGLAMAA